MMLQNINWKVQDKSYIGIAGKIGSGKSTFLYSILQEIPYYKGSIKISGKVAYVEQEPVTFSMSIRDNILFQNPFNQGLYNKALRDSCLLFDVNNFPKKDMTVVGQKGITLSGGQKARLALARALYADPDILVLDDPFSAVDPKVGMQIFQEVIMKQKHKKTIILATHHIQYLQQCDQIMFLQDNQISARGTYKLLEQKLNSLSFDSSNKNRSYQQN